MRRRRCDCSHVPTVSRADDPRLMQAARSTGADVPVCLDRRPRVMRGIGEILSRAARCRAAAGGAGQSGRGGADQGGVRGASVRSPALRDTAGSAELVESGQRTQRPRGACIELQPGSPRYSRNSQAARLAVRAHDGIGGDVLRAVQTRRSSPRCLPRWAVLAGCRSGRSPATSGSASDLLSGLFDSRRRAAAAGTQSTCRTIPMAARYAA